MALLFWILLSGLVGRMASLVMQADASKGIPLNIVVGITGAFLAELIFSPLLSIRTINHSEFSFSAVFFSFLGSIILLAIISPVCLLLMKTSQR